MLPKKQQWEQLTHQARTQLVISLHGSYWNIVLSQGFLPLPHRPSHLMGLKKFCFSVKQQTEGSWSPPKNPEALLTHRKAAGSAQFNKVSLEEELLQQNFRISCCTFTCLWMAHGQCSRNAFERVLNTCFGSHPFIRSHWASNWA